MIIWPLIEGGYEYGVRITKEDFAYEILMNEQMKPVDPNNKKAAMIIEEHQAAIKKLFEKANSVWNLQ